MEAQKSGLTTKSVLLAVILIPLSIYWVLRMEILSGGQIRGGGAAIGGAHYPTTISLFFNVVFIILCLVFLKHLCLKCFRRDLIRAPELLTLYVMLSMSTAMAGTDMIQVLVPIIAYPFWFATAENDWADLFHRYIPTWLAVSDKVALSGFYDGDSSFYLKNHLLAWLPPVVAWSSFLIALLGIMAFLNVVVRRQWIETEKLSYPIIQLPLLVAESGPSTLFANRLLWMGFGLAAALDLVNGLSFLFPAVPFIPLRYELGSLFTEKPFNAIGGMPFCIFPFIIGLAFLIPIELLFSCWFFYLFAKGEKVLGSMFGWRFMAGFPYTRQQSFGAYIGIFLFALWMGRRYFAQVGQEFITPKSNKGEFREPIQYRTALLLGISGFAFLVLFCVKAGVSMWAAFFFLLIYFLLSLGITRMRAELGAPGHDLHYMGPERVLVTTLGTRTLGAQNLTIFSLFYFFNRAYRCHPMPHQLEGFKIAQIKRINNAEMFWAIMFAGGMGIVVTFILMLDRFYRLGANVRVAWYAVNAFGREPFWRLANWLNYPQNTDVPATAFMVIGLGVTLLLLFFRMRFFWWPIHPLGYALADDFDMNFMWSSILLSWFIKRLLVQFGGIRRYRSAVPFFIGLVLGEFVVGSLWSIVGIILGIPTYAFKNW
jgi:hypothetical protein